MRRAPKKVSCVACGTIELCSRRRRDGSNRGPVPLLCRVCEDTHPGKRWCRRCECFEEQARCPVPLRRRDDERRAAGKYRAAALHTCPSCGRTGTTFELRGSGFGPVPRTCASCAIGHEKDMWCHHHQAFEPKTWFSNPGAPRCTEQATYCPSCSTAMTRVEYMGAKRKKGKLARTCDKCARAHVGELWCVGHELFEPRSAFDSNSRTNCIELVQYLRHRTDSRTLEEIYGTRAGACRCCGRTPERLVIDHDHECCPGRRSCGRCVRGRICYECNSIEGKIRNIYGPPFPRLIQEYLDRYAAWRAAEQGLLLVI